MHAFDDGPRVTLPCTIRPGGRSKVMGRGITEVLTRDYAVVWIAPGIPGLDWLSPNMELVLDIELPGSSGHPRRELECTGRLAASEPCGSQMRIGVEFRRMRFVNRDKH